MKITPPDAAPVVNEAQVVNEAPVVATPEEQATPSAPPVAPVTSSEGGFALMEQNPSDWEIFPSAEGITAKNSRTLRVFVGTLAEFNSKIHG